VAAPGQSAPPRGRRPRASAPRCGSAPGRTPRGATPLTRHVACLLPPANEGRGFTSAQRRCTSAAAARRAQPAAAAAAPGCTLRRAGLVFVSVVQPTRRGCQGVQPGGRKGGATPSHAAFLPSTLLARSLPPLARSEWLLLLVTRRTACRATRASVHCPRPARCSALRRPFRQGFCAATHTRTRHAVPSGRAALRLRGGDGHAGRAAAQGGHPAGTWRAHTRAHTRNAARRGVL
jgi:hypothetical protein